MPQIEKWVKPVRPFLTQRNSILKEFPCFYSNIPPKGKKKKMLDRQGITEK
jgi:hypothetical protein